MSIFRPNISVNIGQGDLNVLYGIDAFYDQGAVVLTEQIDTDADDFTDERGVYLYFETPETIDRFKEILDSVKAQLESYLSLSRDNQIKKFNEEGQSIYSNISRI